MDYEATVLRLQELKAKMDQIKDGVDVGSSYGQLSKEFLSLKRSLAKKKKAYENERSDRAAETE